MKPTTDGTTTAWDQLSFERADRRHASHSASRTTGVGHDLVHLVVHPDARDAVHDLVAACSRHTDTVHAHDDALVVACPAGDAHGLRTKLEGLLSGTDLDVALGHGTFPSGTDLSHNVANLRSL